MSGTWSYGARVRILIARLFAVLQRFFHQQNQLRDKIGSDDDGGVLSVSLGSAADHHLANEHGGDHANPFLGSGGNYGQQTRPRFQQQPQSWTDRRVERGEDERTPRLNFPGARDAPHEFYPSSNPSACDPQPSSHVSHSKFGFSATTTTTTTTTVERNFEQKPSATTAEFCDDSQEGGSSARMKTATNGQTYEKNLGEFSTLQLPSLSLIAFSFALFCFMFRLLLCAFA